MQVAAAWSSFLHSRSFPITSTYSLQALFLPLTGPSTSSPSQRAHRAPDSPQRPRQHFSSPKRSRPHSRAPQPPLRERGSTAEQHSAPAAPEQKRTRERDRDFSDPPVADSLQRSLGLLPSQPFSSVPFLHKGCPERTRGFHRFGTLQWVPAIN
jgi:hypothetical protein